MKYNVVSEISILREHACVQRSRVSSIVAFDNAITANEAHRALCEKREAFLRQVIQNGGYDIASVLCGAMDAESTEIWYDAQQGTAQELFRVTVRDSELLGQMTV